MSTFDAFFDSISSENIVGCAFARAKEEWVSQRKYFFFLLNTSHNVLAQNISHSTVTFQRFADDVVKSSSQRQQNPVYHCIPLRYRFCFFCLLSLSPATLSVVMSRCCFILSIGNNIRNFFVETRHSIFTAFSLCKFKVRQRLHRKGSMKATRAKQ